MLKNKTIKILLFIALFLVIIFSWILINDARHKKDIENLSNPGLSNPFGGDTSENDLPGSGNNNQNENPPENTDPDILPPAPADPIVVVEDNPVLKKLSDNSVAGFTFVKEERIIPEDISETPDASIVEVYDFSGYKTIKFGDKADEIVAIKTVLNRQTPSPVLVINTDYDTDMKNAVIDFQNRNGLVGDGVIGPKTYQKLNAFQGLTLYTSAPKPANIEVVPMARYVDQASGILYDKALRKNEPAKKITTKSIPRVAEAFFDSTGERLAMRYLDGEAIATYIAKLTFPKIDQSLTQEEIDAIPKEAEMTGEFLPENLKTLGVSKDGKNIFYMNPIPGGSAGITYNFATKAKKQIFESPLVEWIADWAAESKINVTTKASGRVLGYSYMLDAKTGAFSKNSGGKAGLTTLLSPDGKKLLYAEYANNDLSTFILEIATGKTTEVSPNALPEKCVWTKDSSQIYCAAVIRAVSALYPDDWYMGKISFDDALWLIDMSDMSGNIIYDFELKSGQKIDAVNPRLNPEEDYLGFINKKDGILWGFDLNR